MIRFPGTTSPPPTVTPPCPFLVPPPLERVVNQSICDPLSFVLPGRLTLAPLLLSLCSSTMNQKIQITAHALAAERESSFLWVLGLTLLHFHFSSERILFCNLSCNPFSFVAVPAQFPLLRPDYNFCASVRRSTNNFILIQPSIFHCTRYKLEKCIKHLLNWKERGTHAQTQKILGV